VAVGLALIVVRFTITDGANALRQSPLIAPLFPFPPIASGGPTPLIPPIVVPEPSAPEMLVASIAIVFGIRRLNAIRYQRSLNNLLVRKTSSNDGPPAG